MRILIADDDLTSRTVLAAVLRREGHEVVVAVNGLEAWQALQQPGAPELVILDWIMPGMDGPEVTRRVRLLGNERPPYILMLTSRNRKSDIIAGLDAGANDYLIKPFDLGELRARFAVGRRMVEMQTALFESREAFAHLATYDPLTGTLNRRAILKKLEDELARTTRQADGLAIGMLDIDHFKQINDTYGHQTGDDVLCEIVKVLNEGLRPYDSLGRIGGEEFLLILPIEAGADPAAPFERLCTGIADHQFVTRSGILSLTASIGVEFSSCETSADHMLASADAALYQAKRGGRNRTVCRQSTLHLKSLAS
jgi:diguanylate cyclase (GGDEF)-like protein